MIIATFILYDIEQYNTYLIAVRIIFLLIVTFLSLKLLITILKNNRGKVEDITVYYWLIFLLSTLFFLINFSIVLYNASSASYAIFSCYSGEYLAIMQLIACLALTTKNIFIDVVIFAYGLLVITLLLVIDKLKKT